MSENIKKNKKRPSNFWKDINNVVQVLKPLCDELGRLPTSRECLDRNLSSLYKYANKYHGWESISQLMGCRTYNEYVGNKNANYWTRENTIAEFIKMVNKLKLSSFPTKSDFLDNGSSSLYIAIRSNYKSYDRFKNLEPIKNLGLISKKRNKKWSDDRIVSQLIEICEKCNHFPSGNDLNRMGYIGLRGAMNRYGGVGKYYDLVQSEVQKYDDLKKHIFKKNISKNRYDSKSLVTNILSSEDTKKRALELCETLGHLPTKKEFFDIGEKKLYKSIVKNYKSLYGFAKAYKINSNGRFVCYDGDLARSRIEVIVDNIFYLNNIPHETEDYVNKEKSNFRYDWKINYNHNIYYIELWGYPKNQENEITLNYNEKKMRKIAMYQQLGLNLVEIESDLFYKKNIREIYDYVCKILVDKIGVREDKVVRYSKVSFELLTYNFLDVKELYLEICSKYNIRPKKSTSFSINHVDIIDNGSRQVNRNLKKSGRSLSNDISDLFSLRNQLYEDLKIAMNDLGITTMPVKSQLLSIGNDKLHKDIVRFGGYVFVREVLGIQKQIKWSKDFFEKQIMELVNDYGYIPSQDQLISMNKRDLLHTIHRFGGFAKVSQLYGVKSSSEFKNIVETGYYDDWNQFKKDILPICEKLGRFPKQNELKEIGKGKLYNGMQKHGGLKEVSKKLGFTNYFDETYRYQSIDYCISEVKVLIDKLGRFPTPKETREYDDGLKQGIYKYHGGLPAIADLLNMSMSYTPNNFWKDKANVEKAIKEIEFELGHPPSCSDIQRRHGGLYQALYRHHGGCQKFLIKMFDGG